MSHVLLITTLTVTLTSTSESLFLFGERTRRSCSFTWQTLSKVFPSFLLVSFLTLEGLCMRRARHSLLLFTSLPGLSSFLS
jgi:hypothetical protein